MLVAFIVENLNNLEVIKQVRRDFDGHLDVSWVIVVLEVILVPFVDGVFNVAYAIDVTQDFQASSCSRILESL